MKHTAKALFITAFITLLQTPGSSQTVGGIALDRVVASPLPGANAQTIDQFGNDYSKIVILSATYGSGGRQADVKNKVIDFLVTNPRRLTVNPNDLGVDPAPNAHKELQIVHIYNGKPRMVRWGENEWAYSISLCLPDTREELDQWIPGTKWKTQTGILVFNDHSFGFQKDENDPVEWPAAWKCNSVDRRTMILSTNNGVSTTRCVLNWDCSEYQESSGMRNTCKRLPSSVPGVVPQAPGQGAAQKQPTGLVLDRSWASPLQGGSQTMKDLGTLLSPFAKPEANLAASAGLDFYQGVTYLMPLADARKVLNLQNVIAKEKVVCPGFPKDSFLSYAFDGYFEGEFNKLYLVTDKADQVVAVQLVATAPKRDQVKSPSQKTDWHTYDFINNRSKASTTVWADNRASFNEHNFWKEYSSSFNFELPTKPVSFIRIDSLLMDPMSRHGYKAQNWRALEAVRLYLPKPVMELILFNIQTTNH